MMTWFFVVTFSMVSGSTNLHFAGQELSEHDTKWKCVKALHEFKSLSEDEQSKFAISRAFPDLKENHGYKFKLKGAGCLSTPKNTS